MDGPGPREVGGLVGFTFVVVAVVGLVVVVGGLVVVFIVVVIPLGFAALPTVLTTVTNTDIFVLCTHTLSDFKISNISYGMVPWEPIHMNRRTIVSIESTKNLIKTMTIST